jgi:hypothetical protein
MRTPKEAAEVMIDRYGSVKRALDWAAEHAMSYPRDDPRYEYWSDVHKEISAFGSSLGK